MTAPESPELRRIEERGGCPERRILRTPTKDELRADITHHRHRTRRAFEQLNQLARRTFSAKTGTHGCLFIEPSAVGFYDVIISTVGSWYSITRVCALRLASINLCAPVIQRSRGKDKFRTLRLGVAHLLKIVGRDHIVLVIPWTWPFGRSCTS